MSIPNAVTVLRMVGVAVFAGAFIAGSMRLAFAVLMAAALSDILDGLLARVLRQESDLGSFLDPLADKLFVAVTVGLLSIRGHLPWWLWTSVAVRELTIIAGWLRVKLHSRVGLKTRPLPSGKAAAFALMTAVALVMLRLGIDHPAPHAFADIAAPVLFVVCTVLCWVSLADYLRRLRTFV